MRVCCCFTLDFLDEKWKVFQVFVDCGGRFGFLSVVRCNGEVEESKMADDLTNMWLDFNLSEGESADRGNRPTTSICRGCDERKFLFGGKTNL